MPIPMSCKFDCNQQQRGGSGKTTFSSSRLLTGIIRIQVALMDLDPQGSADAFVVRSARARTPHWLLCEINLTALGPVLAT